MNLKHPYEKHLAEKLMQLPPPGDPDQNWQQMKLLLDKNMPRGGGSGPGGAYRWWIAGTIVVAVVVGTWFGGKQFLTSEQRNEAVAGAIKTVNNKTAPSVASTEKNNSQQAVPQAAPENNAGETTGTTDPRGAAYASTTTDPNSSTPAITNQNESVTGNNATTTPGHPVTNKSKGATTQNNEGIRVETIEQVEKERSSVTPENSGLVAGNNNKTVLPQNTSNDNNKTNSDRKKIYSSNKKIYSGNNSNNKVNSREPRSHHNTGNQPGEEIAAAQPDRARDNKEKGNRPAKQPGYVPSISLPSQPTSGAGLMKESTVAKTVDYTGSAIVAPSGVLQREFTYYTQSDLFPDMVAHSKSGRRKSSRSSQGQEDKKFAIGLSLPLTFPVGDQQAMGFNRQGGMNTISDYIPSPHFQYHFNNKTYLQTGLQFSSPQFIRPLLLYQTEKMMQPNTVNINSIYARKLYYFNLPVSIYHSPLRNFYMGTGLQFSSMLSGVAQYEQVKRSYSPGGGPPDEYILSNYYTKFKSDSLSRRFNTNEVRLLIDMSYYWNRFTVGLQYNQAFNNYVSFQVTPVAPYTFDKNKSLQFYLRYNIWEDKKRKMPKNQTMLTLK